MDRGVDGRTNGRMDGCMMMHGWMDNDGWIHIEFIEFYTVDTVDRIR